MALNHLLMTREIFKTINYFIKMKETAVEWFYNKLYTIRKKMDFECQADAILKAIKKAKEMEKEQMHSEYMRGWRDGYSCKSIKKELL